MAFSTPLRYPGGKGRLGPWLAELLRSNKLSGGTYVEPYAGGAGAAIHLLVNEHVDRIVINDLDRAIHAFWWAVLNETDRFVKRIRSCTVSMRQWRHHRSVIDSPDEHSMFDLGFATFFLNRTNRSGILRGGVIGGLAQAGTYLLDARFNREELSTRVNAIGRMRDRIELFNLDAMEFIHALDGNLPKRSLIYFDPPYYSKASQLYRNFYGPDDHRQIAETVQALKTPWLVTYDNCREIRDLYSASTSLDFTLKYSTHLARPDATEAMFYNHIEIVKAPYLRR